MAEREQRDQRSEREAERSADRSAAERPTRPDGQDEPLKRHGDKLERQIPREQR